MDKCFFVLPHPIYPPPQTIHVGNKESQSGVLCLGDLIPDLKHRDHKINESGVEPYPLNLDVRRVAAKSLRWSVQEGGAYELGGCFDVPALAAALGVEIGAEFASVFGKTVSRSFDLESIELMTIEPKESYIDLVVAREDVTAWIDRHSGIMGNWQAYMITGLIIARKTISAKIEESKSNKPSVSAGFKVAVPEVASAGANLTFAPQHESFLSMEGLGAFVWAVRVTKIKRGRFDKKWTSEPYSSGATFGADKREETLAAVDEALVDEDIGIKEKIQTSNPAVFVILDETGE